MSYNWGPFYVVPTKVIQEYSGHVQLRERLNEELLDKEITEMHFGGPVVRISNPWYFRKKGESTWIEIGESTDRDNDFPIGWDTVGLENGVYEIMGLMHVTIHTGETEHTIARQNVVDVTVAN